MSIFLFFCYTCEGFVSCKMVLCEYLGRQRSIAFATLFAFFFSWQYNLKVMKHFKVHRQVKVSMEIIVTY